MKIFISIFTLLLLFCSCASNPKSFKKEKERVEINPLPQQQGFAGITLVGAAAIVVPKVIDWSFGKIKTKLDERSKEYVAKYSGMYSGDKFYTKSGSTDYKLLNPVIEINRYYDSNKLASNILLGFEPNIDNTLLRLKPLKIKIDESKARLKKSDNDLDLKINLKLKGFWKDKKSDIQSKTVADISFEVKGIILGETYTLIPIGNDEYLTNNDKQSINKNLKTEWFAPIPISVDENGKYLENSFGNYSITVEITEIDDYGKQVEQFGKDIESSKSIFSELAKELLKEE